MRCIWQMDGDKVKGFKCEFSTVEMLTIVSGLKYIVADIDRHPKDRERAQGIYNQIMLCRYYDEADRKTEPQNDWETEKRNNSLCYKCVKECDRRVLNRYTIECNQYEPKTEPQTERSE